MPDLHLPHRDVERISHYLLKETQVPGHLRYTKIRGRVWEGLEVNVEKEKSGLTDDFDLAHLKKVDNNTAIIFEGFIDIRTEGEYSFYLQLNGGTLKLNNRTVVDLTPSSRRGVKKAEGKTKLPVGWNKIELTYIHAGKEPSLKFEMEGPDFERQPISSKRLSISETPIVPYQPYQIDASLVEQGQTEFRQVQLWKMPRRH